MVRNSRTPRDDETRESQERVKAWRPPSLLPVPAPRPGIRYRWIRTAIFGETDNKNVSARFREDWVPVKASDHPEMKIRSDRGSEFPDCIEVGGLLLCQTAVENVEARKNYYAQRSREQTDSVDQAYLRESDSRMPLLKPERRSRTTVGRRPDED